MQAKLQIAVIDNGVHGATSYFADTDIDGVAVRHRRERVVANWQPDFSADDVVLVPNGSDHVAMQAIAPTIARFLQGGGTVLCFCGFFLPWIPGHRWQQDNSKPLHNVVYQLINDPLGLCRGVDIEALSCNQHGIHGWWACGEIISERDDSCVLRDNFGRTVLIADHTSSAGLVIATASGPVGDLDPSAQASATQQLYRNCLRAAVAQSQAGNPSAGRAEHG